MSRELDASTMGALVAGDSVHAIAENPTPEILLAGSVLIAKDADGARRAGELQAQLGRAIDALRAAGLAAIAIVLLAGALLCEQAHAAEQRPTWTPRAAAARMWPGLPRRQLIQLNRELRKLASTRVEIYCAGDFCRTLAEDLDEAFESAGHDSYLETPLFDMGKGIGISPASDDTRAIAAAIARLTGGRVKLAVFDPVDAKGQPMALTGKIIIALARKPH